MSIRLLPVPLILLAGGYAAYAADSGDAATGKSFFAQTCQQCHTADPQEGGGEIGPSLVGLMGRTAGTGDPRFAYTAALKESKLVWSRETLERFLADPGAAVPGTTMPIPVPQRKDRDDLIVYFQSLASAAK